MKPLHASLHRKRKTGTFAVPCFLFTRLRDPQIFLRQQRRDVEQDHAHDDECAENAPHDAYLFLVFWIE